MSFRPPGADGTPPPTSPPSKYINRPGGVVLLGEPVRRYFQLTPSQFIASPILGSLKCKII